MPSDPAPRLPRRRRRRPWPPTGPNHAACRAREAGLVAACVRLLTISIDLARTLLAILDNPDRATALRRDARRRGLLLERRGWQKGRPRRPDTPALAVTALLDWVNVQPAVLLRALGRDATSGSADHAWLRRLRARGRALLSAAPPESAAALREALVATVPSANLLPNGLALFFQDAPPLTPPARQPR